MKIRTLNNYKVVYNPEHPMAMKSQNWKGWAYEHIEVATKYIGRMLRDCEEVHHLNGNTMDNRKENLLVIEKGQHTKLHEWIRRGAPYKKLYGEHSVNCGNSYCEVCGRTLQERALRFCGASCYSKSIALSKGLGDAEQQRKDLEKILKEMPMIHAAKRYGISDTALKKRCEKLNIDFRTIRSQARKSRKSSEKVQRLGNEETTNNLPIAPNTLTHYGEGDEIVQGVQ